MWDFHPLPKFIVFFDEDTALNMARGNLALDTKSEGWERIQADELRLHLHWLERHSRRRDSQESLQDRKVIFQDPRAIPTFVPMME